MSPGGVPWEVPGRFGLSLAMWQLPIVRVSLYLGGCTKQGWGCPSSFYFKSSWSSESVPWAVLVPAQKEGVTAFLAMGTPPKRTY